MTMISRRTRRKMGSESWVRCVYCWKRIAKGENVCYIDDEVVCEDCYDRQVGLDYVKEDNAGSVRRNEIGKP